MALSKSTNFPSFMKLIANLCPVSTLLELFCTPVQQFNNVVVAETEGSASEKGRDVSAEYSAQSSTALCSYVCATLSSPFQRRAKRKTGNMYFNIDLILLAKERRYSIFAVYRKNTK